LTDQKQSGEAAKPPPPKPPRPNGRRHRRRLGRLVIAALVLIFGAGAAWAYFSAGNGEEAPHYRLARVQRGAIVSSVTASGSLKALVTVQVGSQLSGQIKELHADFNSKVKKGQLIAMLDTAQLQARLSQSQADLSAAEATLLMQKAQAERAASDVATAQAEILRAEAALIEARRDYARKIALSKRGIATRSDADKAESTLRQSEAGLAAAKAKLAAAQAALKVAHAQIASAAATVAQRKAAVQLVRVDLDRSEIRAPIDGVVIERTIDVGQTVAASLQAPTLFTIAQDLRSLEVHASVDEADVGRIAIGQPTSFTVSAFPNRTFNGLVKQIRLAPKEEQNVVTYTVVISADNPDELLLPGMTAEVKIISAQRQQVLKVPNASLRFRPRGAAGGPGGSSSLTSTRIPPDVIVHRLTAALSLSADQQTQVRSILAEARREFQSLRSVSMTREQRRSRFGALRRKVSQRIRAVLTDKQRAVYVKLRRRRANRGRGQVWVLGPDGKPKAVRLRIGITDGAATEVVRGDLKAGQSVIVGVFRTQARNASSGRGRPRLRF
jgi:HlyD family secretion protein